MLVDKAEWIAAILNNKGCRLMQLNAYMCPADTLNEETIHLVWYGPLLSGVQGAREGGLNKLNGRKQK